MKSATLTPEAKEALRKTVRSLRERLLRDIREAAESTYRLSVSIDKAALDEAPHIRRQRLEAWLDEQTRAEATGKKKKDEPALRQRFLRQAEKQAASTLLNRLVFLRHIEALGLSSPHVVTGGWNSQAYKELREFAPALCSSDAASSDGSEGYGTLLGLVFDELAHDLPGLFGDVGLTRLFPIPAPTLRAVIEALDDAALEPAWTDDTTLGWVYQFYNDPEREALDAKINDGGKIEPHEIASKTQMFTERYMVEWLLHNSLGQMWLAMCAKHQWRPDFEDVRATLDARRADWRQQREAGDVSLEALMPVDSDLEDRWKYWVPQPMPDDAVTTAPETLRDLKLLDPACGSGHFLVVAFDLLAALYREEAKHRGETWSDRDIAQSIIENNLHGVDIDPRAVQVAAAGLWVKAKQLSRDVALRQMNLVAPVLKLAGLPEDDAALMRLKADLHGEVGIEPAITQRLVEALAGVDHLGLLLKVEAVIDGAFRDAAVPPDDRGGLLERVESFLEGHAAAGDLGLQLDGEQLAAGARFLRLALQRYTVVVANPPYQGTQKIADSSYFDAHYELAREDLYSVFLERARELTTGLAALVTMRSWMFVRHHTRFRESVLASGSVPLIGDLGAHAFDNTSAEVALSVLQSSAWSPCNHAVATRSAEESRTPAEHAASLLIAGQPFRFRSDKLLKLPGCPIAYTWSAAFVDRYVSAPKLGDVAAVRVGMKTSNNSRYLRFPWELPAGAVLVRKRREALPERRDEFAWVPYIKGAASKKWVEPLSHACLWASDGLQIRLSLEQAYGQPPQAERHYFRPGVAYSTIGRAFIARAHRYRSIFDVAGSSCFGWDIANTVCLLNSANARAIVETLNPTINFQVGDVARLPLTETLGADAVLEQVESAFNEHERGRECSVEFVEPCGSPWQCAQDWAQRAVDRGEGEPVGPYEPAYDDPEAGAWVSFAIGVALGRFGADGEGVVEHAPAAALPHGILFVSEATHHDSLAHDACRRMVEAWAIHGSSIAEKTTLREWLCKSFFADVHVKAYDKRPIYFPLSSAKKSFVAWVSIHRWTDTTLSSLLAEHLLPAERALEGELDDLSQVRAGSDKAEARVAEKRHAQVVKLREELAEFIALVRQCAEKGPPPTDSKCPPRERDAPFVMDLEDGVMVNSAALWPLLEAQWRDPKKWWKELASAKGKKDYDWSHLAARYFPTRVDEKCRADPSLGVAHGCFWKYHPQKAHAWELRLQDEIAADFTLFEAGSDELRAQFLESHPDQAADNEAKEQKRRDRKQKKGA